MPLTDPVIRAVKPAQKRTRLFDGGGLYLEVAPDSGKPSRKEKKGKWWRFKYRFAGREKRISLGVYPEVSLKDARQNRDEARRLLASGIDPAVHRKTMQTARANAHANSFEAIAREWFSRHGPGWAETHSVKVLQRLERDVFPWLGANPVSEITAADLLKVVRRIEGRGALDAAHRARQTCSQVFRYAISTGRAQRDPAADLRGALPPVKHGHFAAITAPSKVGELLRAFDAFKGTFVVKCALQLAPLLFVRPGELRKAEWSGFDLEKGEWRLIASKTAIEHLVPLSTQSVAFLRELYALTGGGRYVFPGRDRKKPMSEAAINAALRRMGFDTRTEITGHGFRAMARTILHEELHVKPEVIEHQLAHRVPDALGTAYNRTKFLKERRAMMQQWADYLDGLKQEMQAIGLARDE